MLLMQLQQALQQHLGEANLLAKYTFGDEVLPAVFIDDPAPFDCGMPLMVITHESSNFAEGCSYGRAYNVSMQLRVFGNKEFGVGGLGPISERVWQLFNWDDGPLRVLEFPGVGFAFLSCQLPQLTHDIDGFPMCVMQVGMMLQEKRSTLL